VPPAGHIGTLCGTGRQAVLALHTDNLADDQGHAPRIGADLDGVLLTGDVHRAIGVDLCRKGGTPDADGRGVGGDLVVLGPAFADQAGDGTHAAAQETDGETVLACIVLVGIAVDVELAVGRQGHQPAIGKADLRLTAGACHDVVTGLDQLAFRNLQVGRTAAHRHVPHRILSDPRSRKGREGIRGRKRHQQYGVPEFEWMLHGGCSAVGVPGNGDLQNS